MIEAGADQELGPPGAYTLGGVALGYARAVGGKTTLGVLGAYSRPRLEQDANLTETNSTQVGT